MGRQNTAELRVRKAVRLDCKQVASLLGSVDVESCELPANNELVEEAVQACIDTPDHESYVAEAGDKIVGYIVVHWIPFPMLHSREGYVSDLLVAEDWRGCGVGRRLLGVVEERARELGCVRLMLNNCTSAESFTRGFYQKNGFRQRTL